MASWWDAVVVYFTGKDVAILGPRAAGKTTLYDFLECRTVTTSSPRSQTVARTNRGVVRRKELGLALHKGADLPGSDVHYPDWQRLFQSADVVFYVFDAHLARTAHDYGQRLSQDSRKIKEWGVGDRNIHLVGTHRDTDPLAAKCSPADYADAILELDVIEAVRSRTRAMSIAIGDLATDTSAGELLRQVLT